MGLTYSHCAGFVGDHFLHSSWHGAVLWFCADFDNAEMFL